ncbi:hypothetical protein HNP55_003013 [Paucibacter oligotrophus]|uniref:Metal-binding protein n=1 Tax=Roseateles oligotrophus TaxID=1769250 RepID=A0A840LEI1_9BURK|nr:DUF411 domain-containing protein [Roseateles oligotrophus]MBB4844469.1 hypothetical protein [Roseateles oligotrophus]
MFKRPPTRRRLLLAGSAFLLAAPALASDSKEKKAPAPLIQVWKGPSCGCCNDWIKHLEANGFRVQSHDDGNTDARARLGVSLQYGSCHTGLVGGYAIEGHVPAREIHRLLKERPKAIGLAVPAMPIGSPGMDGPEYGTRKDPYEVLLLAKNGSSSVYQSYP